MLRNLCYKVVFLCVLTMGSSAFTQDYPIRQIKKVVLWGHKLHSHTHSYIHWGFQRAFNHLGYETYWLDNSDNIKNIDLSKALFITEGQVDQRIPIRDDCYYVIHNCNPTKYRHLLSNGHAIILQVYTHDCLKRNEPAFDFCFHYDLSQPIIYMPWATDLLPHEIDTIKTKIPSIHKNKSILFIGTINTGSFGNQPEINAFKSACQENNITFNHAGVNSISMEKNIEMIQTALLAPALQGAWQCKQGYIPCRIFKNISYGAMGITNSETVYKLFEGKIIYNPDAAQLCRDALKRITSFTTTEQYELMDLVKNKHTYLNRIERILSFFDMVHDNKNKVKE